MFGIVITALGILVVLVGLAVYAAIRISDGLDVKISEEDID